MAKRKASRKKNRPDTEMIHFRPGVELGGLIGKFSKQLSISRGEVAKRFTSLTIHGFDVGFYGYADELAEYVYSTFDDAVGQLHVAVVREFGAEADAVEVPREEKVRVVEDWLQTYRSINQLEEETEQKRLKIHVYLGE